MREGQPFKAINSSEGKLRVTFSPNETGAYNLVFYDSESSGATVKFNINFKKGIN